MTDDAAWDLLLRGVVGGVLLFHAVNLLGRGPRAAARAALWLFTVSLLAYLACQRADLLLRLPRPFVWIALALCASATVWLWLAARALFDDRFRWDWPRVVAGVGMLILGLASNAARVDALLTGGADPGPGRLTPWHAAAMLAFTAAALWEVLRGWRDDLVESRRVARRWVALGIGAYAAIALAVELAVAGQPVGMLLPALHVAGIGVIALALALLVARRSLDAVLGPLPMPTPLDRAVAEGVPISAPSAATMTAPTRALVSAPMSVPALGRSAAGAPSPSPMQHPPRPTRVPIPASPAMERLHQAMTAERAYRQEGITVASLASQLGMGEAALRTLINQGLGYRNFNDFLHHHRLTEAAARLATENLPVLTIALECGYGSIGPFNRAFRRHFGMTPTEYRVGSRLARPDPPG